VILLATLAVIGTLAKELTMDSREIEPGDAIANDNNTPPITTVTPTDLAGEG
jgi:hypothetical protein